PALLPKTATMQVRVFVLLSALFAVSSAQLFGGGGGGEMGGGMNPMLMMSLLQMAMADPSAMSFPVVSMLARNPTVLQNPAMLYGLSGMLGVDTNKLIGPMFLANSGGMPGGGNAMGFMPLLPFMGGMGDAGLMT
ncbi:hypothetical protein BaRGS_00014515, partial [Batillaria attramentaria]